ncbi:GD17857 [Drosophila simulans]|uniref:GD17857 n=1 Tax=Drosophila simulans TaxID=7240 RepID=B4NU81_DROSI|nr:GD17857 [Drosophila simulans]
MSRGTLLTQRYNNKSVALAKTIIRSHFREISAGVRCDNEGKYVGSVTSLVP